MTKTEEISRSVNALMELKRELQEIMQAQYEVRLNVLENNESLHCDDWVKSEIKIHELDRIDAAIDKKIDKLFEKMDKEIYG